ncbi:MAG: hypothetical protein RSF73_05315, partial [Ruthenibacterium sp.]
HAQNSTIIQMDVLGVSFFALDGGRNLRIHAFMKNQGYVYPIPSVEQMQMAGAKCDEMPNWPAEGSIAPVDDVLVVKLGDVNQNWFDINQVPAGG